MKVLLAVDGSAASLAAIDAVAALPTPSGSVIEVVSVIPDSFAPEGSPWPSVVRIDPPSDRARVHGDVEVRLVEIASRLRNAERSATECVLEGRPASEIVAEAGRFGADIVVMGARGLSAVRRLLLGSVSAEVIDHAPCPVLVARRASAARVLLATDCSVAACDAAYFMADSGLFDAADIHIVSVADPGMSTLAGISPVDGANAVEIVAHAVEAAEQHARDCTKRAAERLGGLHVAGTATRPDGDIVEAILAEAVEQEVDLIVVGSRNMGTVHRWLVGSVSRSVLHLADASVLIVRPRPAAST
jgi:nucleotide-binding universal stress UspA family protein